MPDRGLSSRQARAGERSPACGRRPRRPSCSSQAERRGRDRRAVLSSSEQFNRPTSRLRWTRAATGRAVTPGIDCSISWPTLAANGRQTHFRGREVLAGVGHGRRFAGNDELRDEHTVDDAAPAWPFRARAAAIRAVRTPGRLESAGVEDPLTVRSAGVTPSIASESRSPGCTSSRRRERSPDERRRQRRFCRRRAFDLPPRSNRHADGTRRGSGRAHGLALEPVPTTATRASSPAARARRQRRTAARSRGWCCGSERS